MNDIVISKILEKEKELFSGIFTNAEPKYLDVDPKVALLEIRGRWNKDLCGSLKAISGKLTHNETAHQDIAKENDAFHSRIDKRLDDAARRLGEFEGVEKRFVSLEKEQESISAKFLKSLKPEAELAKERDIFLKKSEELEKERKAHDDKLTELRTAVMEARKEWQDLRDYFEREFPRQIEDKTRKYADGALADVRKAGDAAINGIKKNEMGFQRQTEDIERRIGSLRTFLDKPEEFDARIVELQRQALGFFESVDAVASEAGSLKKNFDERLQFLESRLRHITMLFGVSAFVLAALAGYLLLR